MFQSCKKCYGVLPGTSLFRINQLQLSSSQAGSAWQQTSSSLPTRHEALNRRTLVTSGQQHFARGLAFRTHQSLEISTICNRQGLHRGRTFTCSVPLTQTFENKFGARYMSSTCALLYLSRCERLFTDGRWKQKGIFVTRPEVRYLSSSSKLSHPAREENVMNVFDRKTKRKQRDRAAQANDVEVYDYIKDEIAYRMVDRIRDVTRKFPVAVDLGCGRGLMSNYLTEDEVGILYQCEMSEKMLEQAPTPEGVKTFKLVVDEEFVPFKEESLDLVISSLSLHWVNDLPGTLRQIHTALKKDGAFIGAVFGGDTLFELRCSLQLAELEREGGFAPHISPFTDMQDLGNLLTRSGYNMLTVDKEELQVNYPSMYELMHDLKGMAENNASWSRKNYLQRDTMAAAAAIYKDMYGNEDGSVPATFQVLFMIGWKPDRSQAKPAARGSATASLKDLDKLNMDVPPKE